MNALELHALGKHFRVPHAPGSTDPRRERLGRRSGGLFGRHDRFWALRGLTLAVPTGQTLGFIGHNGSGKSTLLKILAGVMTPDTGRFTAQGRVGALLELGAGFHPDLTGLENVYLNGALLGLTVREVDRVLPEIIDFAELERFMDMPVRHYSSGMQARLGFAVATRLEPEILLMDETFATGDARFQARALAHVAAMRGRGHTLLLVSHSPELLMELCDQVAWLDAGRLRALGPPREVLPAYRRAQLASARPGGEPRRPQAGLADVFEPVATASRSAIEAAAWQLPELRVTLRIAPADAGALELATAWLRTADGRVLLQSQTPLALAAGPATLRLLPRLDPVIAADWRLALGLRRPGAAEWLARHEPPTPFSTPAPPRDIPTLAHSGGTWKVRVGSGAGVQGSERTSDPKPGP